MPPADTNRHFAGTNPTNGASIFYALAHKPKTISLEIQDAAGKVCALWNPFPIQASTESPGTSAPAADVGDAAVLVAADVAPVPLPAAAVGRPALAVQVRDKLGGRRREAPGCGRPGQPGEQAALVGPEQQARPEILREDLVVSAAALAAVAVASAAEHQSPRVPIASFSKSTAKNTFNFCRRRLNRMPEERPTLAKMTKTRTRVKTRMISIHKANRQPPDQPTSM